jgi:glycosyltransferase involved in cell wall biosynthesis
MTTYLPLVSCIMPTAGRRPFVPHAIRYFLNQDYPNKELVIVDDGRERIADLVPDDPQVQYFTLDGRRNLGAKRNICVEHSRGDLILHWDDDDWSAPGRIRCQVEALLGAGAEVCGLRQMLFYEVGTGQVWLYSYPSRQNNWLAGGSLLYTRAFWRRSPFPNIQIASDTRFVMSRRLDKAVVLPDYRIYVALIHPGNTSPKGMKCPYWSRWSGDLKTVMGEEAARLDELTREARSRPRALRPTHPLARHKRPAQRRPTPPPARAPTPKPEFPPAGERRPAVHILMVVHNTVEMVKISTLKTLQHIAEQDARLVVIDNASTDGAQDWLEMLARRGEILLLRSQSNLGHGPALELARTELARCALLAPYLVTLDSDAFPLSDGWLVHLRQRLQDPVKVAGIRHHRNYIHPSCLMVASQTLGDFGVTFLNEKDSPSRLDVAERISAEVLRRGAQIVGLERVRSFCRGSASEPVYLGSVYEEMVYHHWYTTRAQNSKTVDDVPADAIERVWDHLLAESHAVRREVVVVVGVRANQNQPRRLRNLLACLRALNLQDLERWRYRIALVEQDQSPRLRETVAAYVDQYIFAFNQGPYNRGWGFNIGALLPGSRQSALCLMDADLLVSPGFLREGLTAMRSGAKAIQPYAKVLYLDRAGTERVLADFAANPARSLSTERYSGQIFNTSQGGCLWVKQDLYAAIGGHDERFRGWGREDREFWQRLERTCVIARLPGRLLHLEHEAPAMTDAAAQVNHRLWVQIQRGQTSRPALPIGDPNRYAAERANAPAHPSGVAPALQTTRDWQNWHTWDEERIRRIVFDERKRSESVSTRHKLAVLVAELGRRVLDVGCGPGAMWTHFERLQGLIWVGADITGKMLAVAKQLFPSVPVVNSDSGCLPFPSGSFEVVLLRHILEHQPEWLVKRTLEEGTRVASKAVVIDFYLPPTENRSHRVRRVGDYFLETCWTVADIQAAMEKSGWHVSRRHALTGKPGELESAWVLQPGNPVQAATKPTRVSIIMPTYRRHEIIARTIEKILAQTYPHWELIIVDNDGNLQVHLGDERIRIYRHREKASAAYARNKGLQYAQGDLVCFFDDDDDMFPNYLERFVKAFEAHSHVKMVRAGMIVTGGKVNYSYATPECCLRRSFATPTWTAEGPGQDQKYFQRIIHRNRWNESNGDIFLIEDPLCRANVHPNGGLRSGGY